MARKHMLGLLLMLAWLGSAGCAGARQQGRDDADIPAMSDEDSHRELERELSLYSD